jgi:hypothetical protein
MSELPVSGVSELVLEVLDLERAVAGSEVEVIRFGDGRGRAAYVSDPDGNVLELWTYDVRGELDEVA